VVFDPLLSNNARERLLFYARLLLLINEAQAAIFS
jgi:hypothetical protein